MKSNTEYVTVGERRRGSARVGRLKAGADDNRRRVQASAGKPREVQTSSIELRGRSGELKGDRRQVHSSDCTG